MKISQPKGTRPGTKRRLFGLTSEFSHHPHPINVRYAVRVGARRMSGNPGVDPIRKKGAHAKASRIAQRIWRRFARLALHAKPSGQPALSASPH
ncbi:MAG: hypothetical protein AB9869_01410 [Verrucomicrobiia bacterium]